MGEKKYEVKVKQEFQISNIISGTYGSGKTQEIIEKSDGNSLIVSFTITSSKDMQRRFKQIETEPKNIIHYHQLIYDTAQSVGINLKYDSWQIYENISIFEFVKHNIPKYSTIFIDIDSKEDLKDSWKEILRRYFLEPNGQIYISETSKNGTSLRLNSSVTNVINSFTNFDIEPNQENGKSFFVIQNKDLGNIETLKYILENEIEKDKQLTILGWDLDTLRGIDGILQNIFQGNSYSSFPPHNIFYQVQNDPYSYLSRRYRTVFTNIMHRVAMHWLNKEYRERFNPTDNLHNISTIESFRGLESNIVFLILTPNMSPDLIISAISRAKEKLYIFDFGNREYSSQLKLSVDEVLGVKSFEDKIYITLDSKAKKNILYDFFSNKHKEFTEQYSDMLERYSEQFNIFFQNLFSPYEQTTFINLDNSIGVLNGNIVLHIEQSINKNKNNTKDNYFYCRKIEKINKELIINSDNSVQIKAQLIVKENGEVRDISNDSGYKIDDIQKEAEYFLPPIPITETEEYKKWKVYLDLEERKIDEQSQLFYIDIYDIEFKNEVAIFPKPYNIKFQIKDEIIFSNGILFGIITKVIKNHIYLEIPKDFYIESIQDEDEIELSINKKHNIKQNKNLQEALTDIAKHDFRFYLFGNQSLKPLENIQDEKYVNWFNKTLNSKQKEAVLKSLASTEIFMIQGPPGTGKTSVISEIAYQETLLGKKVLISSESNDAIENAIERLNIKTLYPLIYQSQNRQNKTKDNKKSLPVDGKIGEFYKDRILSDLEENIKNGKKSKDNLVHLDKELKNIIKSLQIGLDDKLGKIDIALKSVLDVEDDEDEVKQENDKHLLRTEKANRNFQENKQKEKEEFQNTSKELKEQSIFLEIQTEFRNELEKDKKVLKELEFTYFEKANILGATLAKVGDWHFQNKHLKKGEKFDVVIVDEVSKATPVLLNFALLRAKKVILVGDHKQLPPMLSQDISLEEFAEGILKKNTNKEKQEVLEELHNHKTVFEKLIKNTPNNSVQLTIQYRMHEDIQEVINRFYENPLECGTDSKKLKNIHKLFYSKNFVWVDYDSKYQEKYHSPSYSNQQEKDKIEEILEQLNFEYKDIDFIPTIGIISFYGKQVALLSKIDKHKFTNLKIDFGTVDTFQGQERDFVIVSMVRSNLKGNIGFAQSFNRINVAFSRAKQLLVIIGNSKTFTEKKSQDNDKVINAKQTYKEIYKLSHKGEI